MAAVAIKSQGNNSAERRIGLVAHVLESRSMYRRIRTNWSLPSVTLERHLHDEFGRTPTLLKAGVAHSQFETVHPSGTETDESAAC